MRFKFVLAFIFLGGMVLQTNMSDILARIEDQNRLVKQEAGLSAAPAAVVHQLKSMNLPQQFKDMKLPDLPQAIKVMNFQQNDHQHLLNKFYNSCTLSILRI